MSKLRINLSFPQSELDLYIYCKSKGKKVSEYIRNLVRNDIKSKEKSPSSKWIDYD